MKLNALLIEKDLTSAELARRLRTSEANVSRWRREIVQPERKAAIKIARVLNARLSTCDRTGSWRFIPV